MMHRWCRSSFPIRAMSQAGAQVSTWQGRFQTSHTAAAASSPPESILEETGAAGTTPTRSQALKRWGAITSSSIIPQAPASNGIGDVVWDVEERMDFNVQYSVPKGWVQRTNVRENYMNIDLTPPPPAFIKAAQEEHKQRLEEEKRKMEEEAKNGPEKKDGMRSAPQLTKAGPGGAPQPVPAQGRRPPLSRPPRDLSVPESLDVVALPSLHGLSISSFAYHRKVQNPDAGLLLRTFLQKFDRSVRNSLEVVSASDDVVSVPLSVAMRSREESADVVRRHTKSTNKTNPKNPPVDGGKSSGDVGGNAKFVNISEKIAAQLGGAVCEIEFRPGVPPMLSRLKPEEAEKFPRVAKGLCRAFFSPSGRFHYVVVFAVPKSEFSVMEDCIVHGMLQVDHQRVGKEKSNMFGNTQ